ATLSGLALSLELPAQEGPRGGAAAIRPPRTPSAFLQIGEDDGITIITPAVEMGQGGHTSLPMIIMEELGGSWDRLRVTDAPAAAMYNNPLFGQQSTVGSFSVRGWYHELRRIGAAARIMLPRAPGRSSRRVALPAAAKSCTDPAGAASPSAAWRASPPACRSRRTRH